MPDEGIARERARAAIRAAMIPIRRPDRVWGGPGAGAPCAVCELPITRDQLELEFDQVGAPDTLHFHIRCFAAWELERTKVEGAPPPQQ